MVDHPKFVAHSDWRETFRLSEVDDDTCKLVVLTDDQLEILRRALKCARKRGNWIDSEDADGYMTPDDGDWDDTLALLDDLEWRLMSGCDWITLDDTNERLGIGRDITSPAQALDVDGRFQVGDDDVAVIQLIDRAVPAVKAYVYYENRASQDVVILKHAAGGEQLVLAANGNVGILKTPGYPLDVNGAAKISGAFGCNGQPPQSKYTVPGNATDLATVIELCNALRKAVGNVGITV